MDTDNAALDGLWDAYRRYREAAARKAAVHQCDSYWPADPPTVNNRAGAGRRADYPGTRCDLVSGHDTGPDPSCHRHRILGSTQDVTW